MKRGYIPKIQIQKVLMKDGRHGYDICNAVKDLYNYYKRKINIFSSSIQYKNIDKNIASILHT